MTQSKVQKLKSILENKAIAYIKYNGIFYYIEYLDSDNITLIATDTIGNIEEINPLNISLNDLIQDTKLKVFIATPIKI